MFDTLALQDPSVQQATASSGQPAGLDDYDPFNKQNATVPAAGGGPPSQPAVMSPTVQEAPPPPYNQAAQAAVTSADFQVGNSFGMAVLTVVLCGAGVL